MTDERAQRATDPSFSPTPAASSAGASSPAIPTNMTSVDWCGLGKGWKGPKKSPHLPWSSATSGSTGGGSTPAFTQPMCRPWDRGDLLKRLSTFKSELWLATPKICGPLACARRGWMIGEEHDTIVCEACGVHIRLPLSSTWADHGVNEAAEAYGEQLDAGHKPFCPWKGNPCTESLAQFLPSQISALIGGFNDRCDALLQFSSLPLISGSAIDELKCTRRHEIDRLLAKPVRETLKRLEDGFGSRQDAAGNPYFQAQRLISLCGWEPRLLPHVVDCEEHSAYSRRKDKAVSPGEGPSHGLKEPTLLLSSRSGAGQNMMMSSDLKCNLASAVLDCSLCGAIVDLKRYVTASRPLSLMVTGLLDGPEPSQKYIGPLKRNASAASGVEGLRVMEAPRKDRDEAGDATIMGEEKIQSYSGALDLHLTIGGGGASAVPLGLSAAEMPVATGSQQFFGQPEGSEMGGAAASYESFGPGFPACPMDEGGSTVDRPQSRMQRADSFEGTVLDFECDEVDNVEVGRKKSYVGESSKRKCGDSSGATALVDAFPAEPRADAEDTERLKRSRREAILQELNKPMVVASQPLGNSIHASSVIAMDTSQGKLENSMDSVENFPQDDDMQGTAFSWGKNERVGNDDLHYIEQAQQSTCHQGNAGNALEGPSDPGVSTSDDGDIDTALENDVTYCDGNAGMGHGASVGISGGSVQMGASHEAEIYGADLSVHKMESLLNEAELMTEVTDPQRQTSESVPRQSLTGQSLSNEGKVNVRENPVESIDALPSLSVAKGMKREDSGQEESWEGKQKGSQGSLGEKLADGHNVVCNVLMQSYVSGGTIHDGTRAADIPMVSREGRQQDRRRLRGEEFDPIHQHHFYCPWINGCVATAAAESNARVVLCGWELTIDALDMLQLHNSVLVAPMESESAASMHEGNGLAIVTDYKGKHSSTKR